MASYGYKSGGQPADQSRFDARLFWSRLSCYCTLLQLAAIIPGYLLLSYCGQGVEPVLNQVTAIASQLGPQPTVGWWSMPANQSMQALLDVQKRLYVGETRMILGTNMSFGTALGGDAANFMFDLTKVEGVTESVPESLRGIYWARGGGVLQLVSFQYARWFDEENVLVVPLAPMMSAWVDGIAGQGGKGFAYRPAPAIQAVEAQINDGAAVSFAFGACPPGARYCKAPVLAAEDANMSFAAVQYHPAGSLEAFRQPGEQFDNEHLAWLPFLRGRVLGSVSLQEPPSSVAPGQTLVHSSAWALGTCPCFETGSIVLTKILSGTGEPVQPFWDEYVASAGKDPVYLWAGFPSESARDAASRRFQARAATD